MDKRQLIEDIRRINTTAAEKFLGQFDEDSLALYLQHLKDAQEGRLRISGGVRKPVRMRMAS